MSASFELTVATWNTQGKARPEMLALLNEVRPDVLFAQEVKVTTWPTLLASSDWSGVFGLDLRPRQEGEGGKRGLGAAILVRSPGVLAQAAVVDQEGFVWPERGVTGLWTPPGTTRQVRLVAYHALHGGHGVIKPQTSQALGLWLGDQRGPILAGMDANSPDLDHPDEALMACMWAQPATHAMERALLGPVNERQHALSDVWRTYLADHPDEATRQAQSPTGPLAITHWTGRAPNKQPRRFDHIWATEHFKVQAVKHMKEGIAAGSDHALVVARLTYQ